MTILDRAPPEWKRPSLPTNVKLQVLLNQDGRCKATGARLGTVENTQFDHRPTLWDRKFDTVAWDTIPPANDPEFIDAIARKAHDVRTNGRGGEKRISSYGSDAHARAKVRHLEDQQAETRRRLLAKERGEPKPRTKWPSRPFAKRRKPTREDRTNA